MSRQGLRSLRDKYLEMQRLRREDESGSNVDPKPAMAVLASRFPGALRQIDRLPSRVIAERLAALEEVLDTEGEPPPWARWEIAYHGRMRATLRVKRAVRLEDEANALRVARDNWARESDEPPEPMTAALLAAIRAPVGGRLNPVVLAAVAVEHGVSVEEVRRGIFPPISGGDDGA